MVGSAGLPQAACRWRSPAIIDKLAAETARALTSPDAITKLQANGLIPAAGSPKAMTESVAGDVEHFGRLIRELGIKAE